MNTVKVIYLDRRRVLAEVERAVGRLVASHPEIARVVLFGSMARGDAVPGSDVDLLLVLTESGESFLDRMSVYMPDGISIGVDVFPYTEQEFRTMLEQGNSFLKAALAEGRVLFERAA